MKIVVLTVVYACTSLMMLAQRPSEDDLRITAKNWAVGVSGFMWFPKNDFQITATGEQPQDFRSTETQINLTLRSGYFVINRLLVGGRLSVDISSTDQTKRPDDGSFQATTNSSAFAIGPWIRYYVPFGKSKWAFYPEFSAGFLNQVVKNEVRDNAETFKQVFTANGVVVAPSMGFTCFVSPAVAIELQGGYEWGWLTGKTDATPADEVRLFTQSPVFEVGVQIYPKRK